MQISGQDSAIKRNAKGFVLINLKKTNRLSSQLIDFSEKMEMLKALNIKSALNSCKLKGKVD